MALKISMGMNIQPGPWGGGNQFGKSLRDYLLAQGEEVSFDLNRPGLDIVLLTEPRANLSISAFNDRDIFAYLARNPRTLVVHRVNECDQRKGTKGVNFRLLRANLCADHTVFVSRWLRGLFLEMGLPSLESSVIHNGSDEAVFNRRGHQPWDGREPLRLVTHHWSSNWMKGFDVYTRLDEMLAREPWRDLFSFTYVGNLPEGFAFGASEHAPPTHGEYLADQLRRCHVYITASRNEPGSHHQNEGAACGLPLLYMESGGMTECCQGYGLAFTPDNLADKLMQVRSEYETWARRVEDYPRTAGVMCRSYHELFKDLASRREKILAARDRRRKLRWRLAGLPLARKLSGLGPVVE